MRIINQVAGISFPVKEISLEQVKTQDTLHIGGPEYGTQVSNRGGAVQGKVCGCPASGQSITGGKGTFPIFILSDGFIRNVGVGIILPGPNSPILVFYRQVFGIKDPRGIGHIQKIFPHRPCITIVISYDGRQDSGLLKSIH